MGDGHLDDAKAQAPCLGDQLRIDERTAALEIDALEEGAGQELQATVHVAQPRTEHAVDEIAPGTTEKPASDSIGPGVAVAADHVVRRHESDQARGLAQVELPVGVRIEDPAPASRAEPAPQRRAVPLALPVTDHAKEHARRASLGGLRRARGGLGHVRRSVAGAVVHEHDLAAFGVARDCRHGLCDHGSDVVHLVAAGQHDAQALESLHGRGVWPARRHAPADSRGGGFPTPLLSTGRAGRGVRGRSLGAGTDAPGYHPGTEKSLRSPRGATEPGSMPRSAPARQRDRSRRRSASAPTPTPTARAGRVALLAVAGLGLVWAVPYYPRVNNPNENVRVYMTAALVEDGTYAIDGMRRRWGWTNDAACVDAAPEGPRPCEGPRPPVGATRTHYSVKAPGTSLLGVPAYAAARLVDGEGPPSLGSRVWLLRVFGSALPLLLFLVALERFLRREAREPALAALVFLSLALGSPLLAYGLLFVSHAISAAAAFAAFMLLTRARRRGAARPRTAAAAGLLSAGASLFEYPCFFASLALSLFALAALKPRRWPAFALGALPAVLAMMHFQASAFGNAFSPGHRFVENPAYRAIHDRGFFGGTGFHPEAAGELLFGARLGLFSMTPLLALGVIGLGLLLRRRGRRLEASVALAIVLTTYLAVCFLDNWDGGWSVGAATWWCSCPSSATAPYSPSTLPPHAAPTPGPARWPWPLAPRWPHSSPAASPPSSFPTFRRTSSARWRSSSSRCSWKGTVPRRSPRSPG